MGDSHKQRVVRLFSSVMKKTRTTLGGERGTTGLRSNCASFTAMVVVTRSCADHHGLGWLCLWFDARGALLSDRHAYGSASTGQRQRELR